jgi:hypothetical protein
MVIAPMSRDIRCMTGSGGRGGKCDAVREQTFATPHLLVRKPEQM